MLPIHLRDLHRNSSFRQKVCADHAISQQFTHTIPACRLLSYTMRFVQVSCPNRSAQSVFNTVRHFDDLLLGVERDQGYNGSKDLFCVGPAIVWANPSITVGRIRSILRNNGLPDVLLRHRSRMVPTFFFCQLDV